MRAKISGIAQWLPTQVRTNADWPPEFAERAKSSKTRELVDINTSAFGVEDRIALRHFSRELGDPFLGTTARRIAPKEMTAPEAEVEAGRAALAEAGVRPEDVDVVLSGAGIPERIVPASGPLVAHLLGAKRAVAYGVDSGCASAVTHLDVAAALVESGRARHVLATQSHLMTRTFGMMHPASPNVGDAATAFVVSASEKPGIVMTHSQTHGDYYHAVTWTRGKNEDPPWWEAGPAFYLGSKNSEQAQELVRKTVWFGAETVREALKRAAVPVSAVEVLASVQPRGWIPGAITEAVGSEAYTPTTFAEYAHLGGCGVIVNLLAARQAGKLEPGTVVVLYAQGAGFTRAASVVRWG